MTSFAAIGALGGLGSAMTDIAQQEFKSRAAQEAEAARQRAIEQQLALRAQYDDKREEQKLGRLQAEAQQRRAAVGTIVSKLGPEATDLDRARALQEAGFAEEAGQYANIFSKGDVAEHRAETRAAQRERDLERLAAMNARLDLARERANRPTGTGETGNFRELQGINELEKLFSVRDAFGEFSIDPARQDQYLMARERFNELVANGTSPSQASMQAYREATGRTGPAAVDEVRPKKDRPSLDTFFR